MAQKYTNQVVLGDGIHYSGPKPIDDRSVVETFADLTAMDEANKTYEGMHVFVTDEQRFRTKKKDGWVMDSSSGSGSSNDDAILWSDLSSSNNVGRFILPASRYGLPQTIIAAQVAVEKNHIIPLRDTKGNIKVPTSPSSSDDAVSKGYVDNLYASVGSGGTGAIIYTEAVDDNNGAYGAAFSDSRYLMKPTPTFNLAGYNLAGIDSAGTQHGVEATYGTGASGTIPLRGEDGDLPVPLEPIADSSATSKSYVDSLFSSLTGVGPGSNISVATPTEDSHAANKQYVDNFFLRGDGSAKFFDIESSQWNTELEIRASHQYLRGHIICNEASYAEVNIMVPAVAGMTVKSTPVFIDVEEKDFFLEEPEVRKTLGYLEVTCTYADVFANTIKFKAKLYTLSGGMYSCDATEISSDMYPKYRFSAICTPF